MGLVSYLQLALPSVNVIRGLVQLLQLPLFTVNTACHIKTGRKAEKTSLSVGLHWYISHFPQLFFKCIQPDSFVLTSESLTFFYSGGKIKENLTWILGSTSSSSSAHCDSSSFSKGSIFRAPWVVFFWGGGAADSADKATPLGAGQTGWSSSGPPSPASAMHGDSISKVRADLMSQKCPRCAEFSPAGGSRVGRHRPGSTTDWPDCEREETLTRRRH